MKIPQTAHGDVVFIMKTLQSTYEDAAINTWRCRKQPMEMPQSTHDDVTINQWRCHNQPMEMS